MARTPFSKSEWEKIRGVLAADPVRFGLPGRVYGSVLLGSFNIRKLGAVSGRNEETWRFLADVCRRFDLLAVQEIMDDLGGLRKLTELMGPEFAMIVSDKTGVFPGDGGLGERLGFIYDWSTVKRTEIATDITYDRSKVLQTIAAHNDAIHEAMGPYGDYLTGSGDRFEKMGAYWRAFAAYEEELAAYNELVHQAIVKGTPKPPKSRRPRKPARKGLPKKPVVKMPTFLSFIRSPFCVSFEIPGHPGTTPYRLMAINAHLFFGNTMADRRQEFEALMDWIIGRVKTNDLAYYPDFVLLGDLNLDYDNPTADRRRMVARLKSFNDQTSASVNVNFPFLTRHAGQPGVFRTNARLSETFDQIGFFCRDSRFPTFERNSALGPGDDGRGPDYGVFNFADLFSQALHGRPARRLSDPLRKDFYARFEHKVSDHMPLWFRLPLPEAERV